MPIGIIDTDNVGYGLARQMHAASHTCAARVSPRAAKRKVANWALWAAPIDRQLSMASTEGHPTTRAVA